MNPQDPDPEYRSPRCVLGEHPHCRDAEPRDSGVPGVRHLLCACPCHHGTPLFTAALMTTWAAATLAGLARVAPHLS